MGEQCLKCGRYGFEIDSAFYGPHCLWNDCGFSISVDALKEADKIRETLGKYEPEVRDKILLVLKKLLKDKGRERETPSSLVEQVMGGK